MSYIYALCHPHTNEIRYVGKAKDLNKRYSQHLHKSSLSKSSYKNSWILSLLSKGLFPKMVVLDYVSNLDENSAEMYWIEQLKSAGCSLTNLTLGVDGGDTCITDERKASRSQKISNALSKNPKSIEHRKALSISKSGKQIHTKCHKEELKMKYSGSGNPFFGKRHSAASVKKIKEGAESWRGKMKQQNGGNIFNEEQLEKMSKNRFNKKGKYYGVSRYKNGFRCRIYKGGKCVVSKSFSSEIDAASYWDVVIGNYFDNAPRNLEV